MKRTIARGVPRGVWRTLTALAAAAALATAGACSSSSSGGGSRGVDTPADLSVFSTTSGSSGKALAEILNGLPLALAGLGTFDVSPLAAAGLGKAGARQAAVPGQECPVVDVNFDLGNPGTTIPDPLVVVATYLDAQGGANCVHTIEWYNDATQSNETFDNPVSGSLSLTVTGLDGVPFDEAVDTVQGLVDPVVPFGIAIEAGDLREDWLPDPQPSYDIYDGGVMLEFNVGGVANDGRLTTNFDGAEHTVRHTEVWQGGGLVEQVSEADLMFQGTPFVDVANDELSVYMYNINGTLTYGTDASGEMMFELVDLAPDLCFGQVTISDQNGLSIEASFDAAQSGKCGVAEVLFPGATQTETLDILAIIYGVV